MSCYKNVRSVELASKEIHIGLQPQYGNLRKPEATSVIYTGESVMLIIRGEKDQ